MTEEEQVLHLVDYYRHKALKKYYGEHLSAFIDWPTKPEWTMCSQILWMCDNVETFLNKGLYDYVNRWLGYLEGASWAYEQGQ